MLLMALMCLSICISSWILQLDIQMIFPENNLKFGFKTLLSEDVIQTAQRYTDSKVCILMSVSSRKQDWKAVQDSMMYQRPLSSFAQTSEPKRYFYSI
jgi:hypothetical protein